MSFTIKVNKPTAVSIDPQPAAKHFDIILGLDFHLLLIPPSPAPIPFPVIPFGALVFDPMDYIHITLPAMPAFVNGKFTIQKNVPMGGTVLINGFYRAAATSSLMGMPPTVPPIMGKVKALGSVVKKLTPLHMVVPKTNFYIPFLAPHDGQVSHGSQTVWTQGSEQSTLTCMVFSCTHVGRIVLNNPMGFFNNYATAIIGVIPMGKPVMVGGTKVEHTFKLDDLLNSLMFMGIMFAAKFALKMLGKLLTKIMAAIEKKFPGFAKFRNAIQPLICKYLGEPVDPASGHMASYLEGFTLNGPIPFCWEANYYSDSNYDGPLGKNIYHCYDISLLINKNDGFAVMNDAAGRPVAFPLLERDSSFFNPKEKYTLHRTISGEYYVSHKSGLQYYFNHPSTNNDGHGSLRKIVDHNGFAISFFYNSKDQLEKIIDSSGRILYVENDQQGRITAITAPHPELGNEGIHVEMIRYKYDEDGRMIEMKNALGYANHFQWKDRYITAREFFDGTVFTFSYDELGRCTAALGPGGLYSYTFDYFDGYTKATNSLGYTKTYYHTNGIVTKIRNSQGAEQLFAYDEADNLIAEVNALGVSTTYSYDDKSNLTAVDLPAQGTMKIVYNEQNLPISITQPNGGVWMYEYDDVGNLVRRTNPVGAVTEFTYSEGLMHSLTNALGATTTFEYNEQHLLSKVILPNGTRVQYSYDLLGRISTVINPNGSALYKQYNMLGRPIYIEKANDNIVEIQYDSMGNAIHIGDKYGNIALRYNFFGKVTEKRQGNSGFYFIYDTEGQLREVVNEHKEIYRFELDEEGNVITETGFDGLTRKYLRDAAGQVVRTTLPDGTHKYFEYTSGGRIAKILYDADESIEDFEYDAMGQLAGATNKHAQVQFHRNLLGLIEEEKCNNYVISSQYNILGQRIGIRSSLGADINMAYNSTMNWLEQMDANGWNTQIQYNAWGQEMARRMTGELVQQNSYDRLGNLLEQTIIKDSRKLQQRAYSWDGDRLTAIRDSTSGMKQFIHDEYGNLSEILYGDGSVEYRLPDAVGNLYETPQKQDRKYSKGGRLVQSKNATYRYDQLGNLVTKEEHNGKLWQYKWNASGMLEQVIRPDGESVNFKYDALGRRLEKRFKQTITKWIWDGNKPLHEWKEFDAKESSADDLITWIFNNNNFAPTAKIKGDKKYSIITDHLGTPIQGYNNEGDLIWQREISSYGEYKMLKGDPGFCNYLYQGQTLDTETGLAYNRFRYYSPEEGMYISQDPIRLLGGSRLYKYVENPAEILDPFGLAEQSRTPDGKFAPKNPGDTAPGSDAVSQVKAEYEADPNYVVKGEEISFRDGDGQLRRYDLVVENVKTGEITGVEVKASETASYNKAQRDFDSRVGTDSTIKPVGNKAEEAGVEKIDNAVVKRCGKK